MKIWGRFEFPGLAFTWLRVGLNLHVHETLLKIV